MIAGGDYIKGEVLSCCNKTVNYFIKKWHKDATFKEIDPKDCPRCKEKKDV